MPKVTFAMSTGERYEVDGQCGMSIMEVAVRNSVPGILADCGGCMTCGTCHSYISPEWAKRMPLPSSSEEEILDGVLHCSDASRLACQIQLTDELDGLVVEVPPSQTA
jgi:ferredoxin, 2Fe-2S